MLDLQYPASFAYDTGIGYLREIQAHFTNQFPIVVATNEPYSIPKHEEILDHGAVEWIEKYSLIPNEGYLETTISEIIEAFYYEEKGPQEFNPEAGTYSSMLIETRKSILQSKNTPTPLLIEGEPGVGKNTIARQLFIDTPSIEICLRRLILQEEKKWYNYKPAILRGYQHITDNNPILVFFNLHHCEPSTRNHLINEIRSKQQKIVLLLEKGYDYSWLEELELPRRLIIPPLRNRIGKDLELILEDILKDKSICPTHYSIAPLSLDEECKQAIFDYSKKENAWPQNFRELRRDIRRAVIRWHRAKNEGDNHFISFNFFNWDNKYTKSQQDIDITAELTPFDFIHKLDFIQEKKVLEKHFKVCMERAQKPEELPAELSTPMKRDVLRIYKKYPSLFNTQEYNTFIETYRLETGFKKPVNIFFLFGDEEGKEAYEKLMKQFHGPILHNYPLSFHGVVIEALSEDRYFLMDQEHIKKSEVLVILHNNSFYQQGATSKKLNTLYEIAVSRIDKENIGLILKLESWKKSEINNRSTIRGIQRKLMSIDDFLMATNIKQYFINLLIEKHRQT